MAFVCDICDGSSILKQDGAFVCQGCGVKYTAEEVRKIVLAASGLQEVDGEGNPVVRSTVPASVSAPEAAPAAPSRVGKTVQFGSWVQDASDAVLAGEAAADRVANIAAGIQEAADFDAQPIEWLVVAEEADRELLLAADTLEAMPYNKQNVESTWETCGVRAWLNGEFLEGAFTEDERQRIVTVENDNADNKGYRTNGGASTQDVVFVLAMDQAKKLFETDDDRLCRPSRHAEATGGWTNEMGYTRWWLRAPGFMQNMAAYVDTNGEIMPAGIFVDNAGITVRPAMWVKKA